MTEKIEDLHTLAKSLLEYETLTGEEIIAVLKGIELRSVAQRGPVSRCLHHGDLRVCGGRMPDVGCCARTRASKLCLM